MKGKEQLTSVGPDTKSDCDRRGKHLRRTQDTRVKRLLERLNGQSFSQSRAFRRVNGQDVPLGELAGFNSLPQSQVGTRKRARRRVTSFPTSL